MFRSLSNYLQDLATPMTAFNLGDIANFPISEYQENQTRYSEMEQWYDGTKLDEEVFISGKQIDRYPVKVNPIKNAVSKHTHFLFGETKLDDRPLVLPKIRADNKGDKEAAKKIEDLLNTVWYENNGSALQHENGSTSQIYGGCVFRINYDPTLLNMFHSIPIGIETIHPKNFIGVPDSTDMWNLREAWVVTELNPNQAFDNSGIVFDGTQDLFLVEHWTREEYTANVNDFPAKRFIDGEWIDVSGPNIFGIVPIVYIPHIRVKGFYGENIFDVSRGIIKELILRIADFGDAVTAYAHSYVGMRNVNNSPQVDRLAPSLYAINLGINPSITGHESQPDLFDIRRNVASAAMHEIYDLLYMQLRRDMHMPEVLDGEDKGSQRSGLTLAIRALSLQAHTEDERIFWTTGLNQVDRIILRLLAVKGESNVTQKDTTRKIRQQWFPILPRDRETVVQEVVSRMASKTGSPEHMLEILGDVEDIPEELKQIIDWLKEEAKIMALAQPSPFGTGPQGENKPSGATPAQKSSKPTPDPKN